MPKILGPNVFILIRVSSAALLFWVVMLLTKSREKIDRKDIPRLMLCALFGVAVNQLFFFNGLNLSSSINASIIMTMNPIMVVVLSFFLLLCWVDVFILIPFFCSRRPFWSSSLHSSDRREKLRGCQPSEPQLFDVHKTKRYCRY